jgi:hypothetical protein
VPAEKKETQRKESFHGVRDSRRIEEILEIYKRFLAIKKRVKIFRENQLKENDQSHISPISKG